MAVYGWSIHEDNINGKIKSDYKGKGKEFEKFKEEHYLPFKMAQSSIAGLNKQAIIKRVPLLEDYLKSIKLFNADNWITAQSKFRSSVLEEFCGWLFKNHPKVSELGLSFFKKGVYAGMSIDKDGKVKIKSKDIDFCIGKIVDAKIAGEDYEIKIPIVGVECKTYIDNTMFSEAQFTAQKLKGGSPGIKIFVIAETNEIAIEQLPSQSPVDQVYILREAVSCPIDAEVVWDFFKAISDVLDKISMEQLVKLPGKLLICQ